MHEPCSDEAAIHGAKALSLMEEALDLLDSADFPGEVGADLDQAICRLRTALGITGASDGVGAAPRAAKPFDERKT